MMRALLMRPEAIIELLDCISLHDTTRNARQLSRNKIMLEAVGTHARCARTSGLSAGVIGSDTPQAQFDSNFLHLTVGCERFSSQMVCRYGTYGAEGHEQDIGVEEEDKIDFASGIRTSVTPSLH